MEITIQQEDQLVDEFFKVANNDFVVIPYIADKYLRYIIKRAYNIGVLDSSLPKWSTKVKIENAETGAHTEQEI